MVKERALKLWEIIPGSDRAKITVASALVFAVIFGFLVQGEAPTEIGLIGGALIGAVSGFILTDPHIRPTPEQFTRGQDILHNRRGKT